MDEEYNYPEQIESVNSGQSVAEMQIQRLDNDVLEYLKQSVTDDVIIDLLEEIDRQPMTMKCRHDLTILIKEQFSREYVVNNYDERALMRRWLELREKIIFFKAGTRRVNHSSINYILAIIEGHANNKVLRSSDKGFERKQQQTNYTNQSSTFRDETRKPEQKSGLSAVGNRR